MVQGPPAHLLSSRPSEGPAPDKLDKLRAAVREVRDLTKEKTDTEERLRALSALIANQLSKELPDLFAEAGVSSVGIPAEGNYPAYEAQLGMFYKANISAEWDDEKRARGFAEITAQGWESIVRVNVQALFDKGDMPRARALAESLVEQGYDVKMDMFVPWQTLTATLREHCKTTRSVPSPDVLQALGATVGPIVNLKEKRRDG